MLNILVKIIRNKSFLYSIIIAPLVFILLNIGLIFNIPNIVNIAPKFVSALAEPVTNEITLTLFTTLITIFVLFFTFVQFSFSRANLSGDIIRKYIIEDENSFRYIGYQFSFTLILGYFTISPNIHKLNNTLCIVMVLISVSYSVVYFFWIINNVSAKSIFQIILKKLKFEEISRIEKEAYSELSNYQKLLTNKKLSIKVNTNVYLDLFLSEHYPIYSERRGFIKRIDIDSIDALLSPFNEVINKIIIDVKIGEYIPKYEPLHERSPKTTLMRIEKKLPKNEVDEIKQKEFIEKLEKTEIYRKLVDSFQTEDKKSVYKNNLSLIEDLLSFFIDAIEKEPTEADKLLDLFTSFIIDNIELSEDSNWVKEIGLSENLFIKIIGLMEDDVKSKEIENYKFETLLSIIYSFRNLAVKHKSFKLLAAIMDLAQLIFNKITSDSSKYNSRISIIILHLQEISLSTIVYGSPEPSLNDVCKNWSSFYYPLISKTITSAISSYYLMIKYFHRRDDRDNYYNIIPNTQYLLNLLSPLNHFKPFEELSFSHPYIYSKKEREIVNGFAREIVYTAILIFIKVKREQLPNWLLYEIAFPICKNCNSPSKYKFNSIDILNDLFYSNSFNYPYYSILSDEFETNKIHESGAYTPVTFNIDLFWFTFSIFYKLNDKKFFPNAVRLKTEYSLSRISAYNTQIDNYKSDFIMKLFNISAGQLDQFMTEYKKHIEYIL